MQGAGLSVAVLLYTLHNGVSALAAYPAGQLGDRRSKLGILCGGYGLGVVTNMLLAVFFGSLSWLVVAIVLSGCYLAIEETLEKAVAAEFLPRELRSLGLGILACANAVGDMGSSLYVGVLLGAGHARLAFAAPAVVGLLGMLWMLVLLKRGMGQSQGVQVDYNTGACSVSLQSQCVSLYAPCLMSKAGVIAGIHLFEGICKNPQDAIRQRSFNLVTRLLHSAHTRLSNIENIPFNYQRQNRRPLGHSPRSLITWPCSV